jgi:hypothetical protein
MRLPRDATLLVPDPGAADDALLKAWGEEALPLLSLDARGGDAFAGADLEARLDAIGATTLVFAEGFARDTLWASVHAAAARGYRVFVVGGEGAEFGGEARVVGVETAVEAARRANFRHRWALARRGG